MTEKHKLNIQLLELVTQEILLENQTGLHDL